MKTSDEWAWQEILDKIKEENPGVLKKAFEAEKQKILEGGLAPAKLIPLGDPFVEELKDKSYRLGAGKLNLDSDNLLNFLADLLQMGYTLQEKRGVVYLIQLKPETSTPSVHEPSYQAISEFASLMDSRHEDLLKAIKRSQSKVKISWKFRAWDYFYGVLSGGIACLLIALLWQM